MKVDMSLNKEAKTYLLVLPGTLLTSHVLGNQPHMMDIDQVNIHPTIKFLRFSRLAVNIGHPHTDEQ